MQEHEHEHIIHYTVDDEKQTTNAHELTPTQILQHRTQRRELTQVELARPVGRYLGDHRDAFGQHLREGGNGGQHGCRPGAAGAQVMHVRGGAYAAVRAPAGLHVLRMPEPAPGIRTVSGSCSASLAMLNSPPPTAHTRLRSRRRLSLRCVMVLL